MDTFVVSERQSGYFSIKSFTECLTKKFGGDIDFKVRAHDTRLKYEAPSEVSETEIEHMILVKRLLPFSHQDMTRSIESSALFRSLTTSLESSDTKLSSNDTEISVFKSYSGSSHPEHDICRNQSELRESLNRLNGTDCIPIISLHCQKTLTPLRATIEDLSVLFEKFDIDPDYINAISAFGDRPNPADGGCHGDASCAISDMASSCWFRLQYMERNGREGSINPWSVRHTAIYHAIENDAKQYIVVVNPGKNSVFEKKLRALQLDTLYDQEIARVPHHAAYLTSPAHLVILLLLETYVDNWKAYKNERWRAYERVNDRLSTLELASPAFAETLETLQSLRGQQDKAMVASTFCQGNLRIVKIVQKYFEAILRDASSLPHVKHRLDDLQRRVQGYEDGFRLLQDRISNSIELLNYTVGYQTQNAASLLNESLLNMTKNTVDDSVTIKVITILSLVFLPGGFVATIYGMNFFDFEDPHGLVIGKNFWIFVVTWLPLTFLTIGAYLFIVSKLRKIKGKSPSRDQGFQRMDTGMSISQRSMTMSLKDQLSKLRTRPDSKLGTVSTQAEKSV